MNKLAVTLSAACMAVAGMVMPASAQMNSLGASSDASMIYDFSASNLLPILTANGYTYEVGTIMEREAVLAINGADRVILMPVVCGDGSRCLGLAMLAFFQGGLSLEGNNQYNNGFFFAHAEKWEEDTVIERYLITDYGYSVKTMGVDLAVFFDSVAKYRDFSSVSVEASFGDDASTDGKIGNALSATSGEGHDSLKNDIRRAAIDGFPQGWNDDGYTDLIGQ
ncbi:hypothetical protein FF098_014420 [Parvularcula flava]|uniref:Uncharacterized protein n=1 Tax=Aquisalinus luteolus TaxID=1566827 RepID=A0A8J3EVD9_9PROT|nr:hypothetical protein [Aquisalinus luteolus]NHK29114.1 hypothetical protein [Aquisalinus luteolus]GGI00263.1 hypothetical protein GCM10011355_28140 [Aquisalinus luteolus]